MKVFCCYRIDNYKGDEYFPHCSEPLIAFPKEWMAQTWVDNMNAEYESRGMDVTSEFAYAEIELA
jgi:hypothetical protein